MKRSTSNIIEEYKGKLSGYLAMYSYNLVNLCIEADPISLLGVTVDIEGLIMKIEEVAQVGPGDDKYTIKVYPKSEKQLLMIGKGIAEEHPEFSQDMETLTFDDGDELRYIKLTMPEVNDDRKKLLENGVKIFHDECAVKVEANKTIYSARVTADLIGASQEDVEEAKKQMEELNKQHTKICEDLTELKNKEIEDAYKQYLERQKNKESLREEKADAEGKDVTSNLKME